MPLHEELKGYKDGFLLETVHKPIIRDLISLYDDLSLIHRQMQDAVADAAKLPPEVANKLLARLKTMDNNIEHNCEFIVEVLARLEVMMLPVGSGKLDKQTQRAVAIEIAEDPDEDGDIVRMVKRGFYWKDRVLRAEEVIIKKWKEGFLVALAGGTPSKVSAFLHKVHILRQTLLDTHFDPAKMSVSDSAPSSPQSSGYRSWHDFLCDRSHRRLRQAADHPQFRE